ncbi:hypothetical protein BEWA_012710 [Theileria equi strain WA]|uniref:Uncharacterized protein n=1 Tax=Theileria equi strain WA TaxID=1537102 RepID=L1LBA0_THEEQ|nr:hypothetical protein BEWA_012710 [Theileria equi strain WA]EKX72712.1 hypothetical protein BEWA_012710 [Theileria equi strain WA]|eukprot:XP_004832164.1 hypothetical protein BEWA_012710 [Theileria equi strain WA]
MKMEEVTIKLGVKSKDDGDHPTYNGDESTKGQNIIIKVTVTEEPRGSDFYKYTHEDNGGEKQLFELKEVLDGNSKKIEGIPPDGPDKKVTSVSAYYWRHDKGGPGQTPNKVLLVEVSYSGSGGTKYYVRGTGIDWVETFLGDDLEKTLDEQNCYSNDAVTLDLTKDAYGTEGRSPCCDGHKSHSKVSVTPVPVNHTHHDHPHVGSNNLTVKKYSILGTTLAAIKLADTGEKKKKKRITFSGQPFPMDSVESIYALYSGDNREPKLIYVNSIGDQTNVRGWYQNNGSDGEWTKATDLQGVTPETINDCPNWNNVVGKLKHSNRDLQECKELSESDKQKEQQSQRSEGSDEELRQVSEEKRKKEEQEQSESVTPRGPPLGAPGPAGPAGAGASGTAEGTSDVDGTDGDRGPTGKAGDREPGSDTTHSMILVVINGFSNSNSKMLSFSRKN